MLRKNNIYSRSKIDPVGTQNSLNNNQQFSNTASIVNIINFGEVISIDDRTDSGIIYVRIHGIDDKIDNIDIPSCLPLLTQFITTLPEIGEMVCVICQNPWQPYIGRFWIGPIFTNQNKNQKFEDISKRLNL